MLGLKPRCGDGRVRNYLSRYSLREGLSDLRWAAWGRYMTSYDVEFKVNGKTVGTRHDIPRRQAVQMARHIRSMEQFPDNVLSTRVVSYRERPWGQKRT